MQRIPTSRRVPLVLGLVLLASCGGFAPTASAPLVPPSTYRQWWTATEACSGLSGDFARVRFEVVPGGDFECPSGRCVGRWEPPATVYLSERWVGNEMVVRHEMLHVLIGRSGHPDPPFQRGCGLTWDSWTAPSTSQSAAAPHIE